MKNILQIGMIIFAGFVTNVNAAILDMTYNADDQVIGYLYFGDSFSDVGGSWGDPSSSDYLWHTESTAGPYTLLDDTEYSIIFAVANTGGPGGFIAELDFGTHSILTDESWLVLGRNTPLTTATSYGINDRQSLDANSWYWPEFTSIDSQAQWIWDDSNWGPEKLLIGTTFKTASVPEPALLSLFGAGLIGLGFVRRFRKA